jgi:hypothetical protein
MDLSNDVDDFDFECLQNLINFLIFYNIEMDAQTVKCTSLSSGSSLSSGTSSKKHYHYHYYNTIPNENIVNFRGTYFPTLFMGLFFNIFMGTGLFDIETGRPDERARKIFGTRESQNEFFSKISSSSEGFDGSSSSPLGGGGVSIGDRLIYIVDDISKGVSIETERYHNFLMDCCRLYNRNEIEIRNVIDAVYIFLLEKYWDEVLSKISISRLLRGKYLKLKFLKYEVCCAESNISDLLDRIFNEHEQGLDIEIRESLIRKKRRIILAYKFVSATSSSQKRKPFYFFRCFEKIKLFFSIKKLVPSSSAS